MEVYGDFSVLGSCLRLMILFFGDPDGLSSLNLLRCMFLQSIYINLGKKDKYSVSCFFRTTLKIQEIEMSLNSKHILEIYFDQKKNLREIYFPKSKVFLTKFKPNIYKIQIAFF